MKYCKKCKVFVAGDREKCPLCENSIENKDNRVIEEKFPVIKKRKSIMKFIWKIFILSTLVIAFSSVIINYEVPHQNYWSKFVLIGIFTLWVCTYVALKKYKNVLKCLLYETIVVTAFIIFWDYYTGWHNWSIDFVMPIIFSLVIFTMGLLSKVLKIDAEEHIVYLVSLVIFGLVPGILCILDKVVIKLPSMICTGISCVTFSAVLLFEGRKMWLEFKKRLHI